MQEAKAEEERRRQQETEQDYLGPFVARRGDPDSLLITQKLAFDIREDALNVRTLPLSSCWSWWKAFEGVIES